MRTDCLIDGNCINIYLIQISFCPVNTVSYSKSFIIKITDFIHAAEHLLVTSDFVSNGDNSMAVCTGAHSQFTSLTDALILAVRLEFLIYIFMPVWLISSAHYIII